MTDPTPREEFAEWLTARAFKPAPVTTSGEDVPPAAALEAFLAVQLNRSTESETP